MNTNVPEFAVQAGNSAKAKKKAKKQLKKAKKAAANQLTVSNPAGIKAIVLPKGQSFLVGKGAYSEFNYEKAFRDFLTNAGNDAGEWMGNKASGLVSRLLGRGAYSLRRNNIMNGSMSAPRMKSTNDSTDLVHHEFLADVVATGNNSFNIQQTVDLNAGLQVAFQYASQIASAFEEVEYLGLVLCYEPSSGSISTTQALGNVMFATQYDMQDAAFASEVEMLDYEFATAGPPHLPALHPIECDPRQNQLARFYVRQGLLTGTTTSVDSRYNTYDLGRVTIATVGCPASQGTVLGKLYWTYHMRFWKPKLGWRQLRAVFNNPVGTWSAAGGGAVATITALPALATSPNASTLQGVVLSTDVTTKNLIVAFPASMQNGNFEILIGVSATVAHTFTKAADSVSATANCTVGSSNALASVADNTPCGVTTGFARFTATLTGPSASVTITNAITGNEATTGTFSVFIEQNGI